MGTGVCENQGNVRSGSMICNGQEAAVTRDIFQSLLCDPSEKREPTEKQGPECDVEPDSKLPAVGTRNQEEGQSNQDHHDRASHHAERDADDSVDAMENANQDEGL